MRFNTGGADHDQPDPYGEPQVGEDNGDNGDQQGNGVNGNGQGWNNDVDNGNTDGQWEIGVNGENGPIQGNNWKENNNSGDQQANSGNEWGNGVTNGNEQMGGNSGGDAGWDNNNDNVNNAAAGADTWGNNDNSGNNNGNGVGGGGGVADAWGADNTNAGAAGGNWTGDNNGGQAIAGAGSTSNAADVLRELYGPHGPYYSFRALRLDEPQPDAEEEPRYDVPQSLAAQRGSTKQVQPGPGYRYFKKRMIPEYIDSMETPYARFVFKYRTKGKSRTWPSFQKKHY